MNLIRTLALVVAAIGIANNFAYAQSYTIVPNDTVFVNSLLEDQETLSIQQLNLKTDTLLLKWKKVSAVFPSNWDISLCDNQFCNTNLADSGTMSPVLPSGYGLLLIHSTSHVNTGTAIIRYAVWDIKNPGKKDTLTFIVRVNPAGIAINQNQEPSFWISNNIIHLKNNADSFNEIRIMFLSGKEIFRRMIPENNEIEIPKLSEGFFIIQLMGDQKMIQRKIFIQP